MARRLHLQMFTYGSPFTVCIDTGADCSLLTDRAYHHLKKLYNVPLFKETRVFHAAQGSPLNIIGSVTLPVSFHNHDYTFDVKFYVVTNFVLNCDALFGYDELVKHDISIHPRYHAVSYNGFMYYASDSPVSVLSVASRRVHFEQSCLPAFDEALLPQRTQTSSSSQSNLAPSSPESKRSVSSDSCVAVIVGDQFIGPTSATKVPVRVLNAPVGASVISHPDSARIQRLALEGTLSVMRSGHITDALVTNLTGSSITLKDGVHLGSFSVIDEVSFQDSPPLIGAVDSQSTSSCSSAELITQLEAHVKVVDFPGEKQRLFDTLVAHRQAIAFPGEPLGVTNRVQHHIDLQPNTSPIHVPSYRLPHSQRQVAQNLVENMLHEGIIQDSCSPWNSPLFLVPKKDGSYRAVIDFRKVNSVTVPDHYPLPVTQLVIPNALIPTVLSLIHDLPHAGHPGRDKSIEMARTKYFWPNMSRDITNHVAQCVDCALNKGNTKTAPIQEYLTPARPFETVALDLLQLPRSSQGSIYVLVCVDHFSRYTVLIPLPNKSASSVAHAFVSHFICPFTTPSVLLTDNGTEFKNEVLQKICQQFNITQTFITAYHPASNGLVERTNRKILNILRHLVGKFHESWQDWLPHVSACINATINSSTGRAPHAIVFGHDKRFPFDMLEQPRLPVYSVDDYVQNQARAMQIIHDKVRSTLQSSRTLMTQRQHAKATPVSFAINDVVFKSAPERQSKLHSKFSGPFLIQEKLQGNKFKIFNPSAQTSEVVHADRLKKSDVRVPTSSPLPLVPVSSRSVSSTSLPSSSSYNLRSRANSL